MLHRLTIHEGMPGSPLRIRHALRTCNRSQRHSGPENKLLSGPRGSAVRKSLSNQQICMPFPHKQSPLRLSTLCVQVIHVEVAYDGEDGAVTDEILHPSSFSLCHSKDPAAAAANAQELFNTGA